MARQEVLPQRAALGGGVEGPREKERGIGSERQIGIVDERRELATCDGAVAATERELCGAEPAAAAEARLGGRIIGDRSERELGAGTVADLEPRQRRLPAALRIFANGCPCACRGSRIAAARPAVRSRAALLAQNHAKPINAQITTAFLRRP